MYSHPERNWSTPPVWQLRKPVDGEVADLYIDRFQRAL